jgi:hypothetical protein
MPTTARAVTVLPSQGANGINWVLCDDAGHCGGPGANPPSDYPTLEVAKGGGPDVFSVTISNPTLGITFASNPKDPTKADDALWVEMGKGKHPNQKGNGSNGHITDATLTNSTTLTFTDHNHGNSMWMSYRLNFVGQNNAVVNPIDPDIKNGGGGNFQQWSTGYSPLGQIAGIDATGLLIGLIVGLIVGYFAFRMRKQAR